MHNHNLRFFTFGLAAIAAASLAAEPTDLTKLRESWLRAVQQATTPLDKKYVDALSLLKVRYTKEGKLEDALVVDNELKQIASRSAVAPVTPAPSGKEPTKNQAEKVLLASKWLYFERGPAEDKPGTGPGNVIVFKKDGKAMINESIETSWKVALHGELSYRLDTPKYLCTFKLQPDGSFAGKCTGSSAATVGFVHLIPQQ